VRWRVAARAVAVLSLLAFLGFLASTKAGAALLWWSLEHHALPVQAENIAGKADALVVLGGRTARIHEAARLHLATGLPLLITGKGTGDSGFVAESEKMEDILLRRYGVGPRWVETESIDTHQNAAFSWCLVSGMGVRRVALVTDPHHMLRAAAEFQSVGFEVLPVPTQDKVRVAWRPRFTWSAESFRPGRAGWEAARRPLLEWGGAVVAVVQGALFPRPSCP
jgi:uncharacterized SAM-binding protein YcdF (DUF218 family)